MNDAHSARPLISADEVRERVEAAAAEAATRGLNGLIVWGRGGTLDALSDLHYFSQHFSPGVWVAPSPPELVGCEHGCLLIELSGSTTLVVTDHVASRAVADRVVREWNLARGLIDVLGTAGLSQASIGIIGEEVMPFSIGRMLQNDLPDLELVGADDIGHSLRRRLSDREQEMMVHAGQIGSAIYDALCDGLVPGALEGQAIGRALAEAARTPGCAHWNFLAASGPAADRLIANALPSWEPNLVYQPGDVTHIDCFGLYEGYYYDLARTVVVGHREGDATAKSHEGVRRACTAMARALRPGITAAELHAIGSRELASLGLSPVMGSFGHGIGAGFFPPYVLPGLRESHWPFEAPMGIALEVLARDELGHVAYHEDNFLLTDAGAIQLTSTLWDDRVSI